MSTHASKKVKVPRKSTRISYAKVRRTGGSFAITIPKEVCEQMGVDEGMELSFSPSKAGVLIRPEVNQRIHLRPRRPIKQLLKQGGATKLNDDWDSSAAEGELL